jgi:hypothetical protein
MDIALLYFDDCPNWKIADERLAAIADPDAGVGLSCRVYRTHEGPAGAPSVEQLREALAVGDGTVR